MVLVGANLEGGTRGNANRIGTGTGGEDCCIGERYFGGLTRIGRIAQFEAGTSVGFDQCLGIKFIIERRGQGERGVDTGDVHTQRFLQAVIGPVVEMEVGALRVRTDIFGGQIK